MKTHWLSHIRENNGEYLIRLPAFVFKDMNLKVGDRIKLKAEIILQEKLR